jgi:hypothetical protein
MVIAKSQEVIMKGWLITIALSAIVLVANEATARPISQHHAYHQTHVRQMPGTFAYAHGYATQQTPQSQFESRSLGQQPFPNPDRAFPVPPHYY